MTYSVKRRTILFFMVSFILVNVFAVPPAICHATFLSGTDIPLIDGARIVKEKQFQGSGRFEFEVDIAPEEAVEFYHQAMQAKGWPAGRVMAVGKTCTLMQLHQGNTFSVKAEDKGGRTSVTLAVILKSSIEKALDPAVAQRYHDAAKSAAATKEKKLPENSTVTVDGSPIGKGDVIRRPQLPAGYDESDVAKKDDGNLQDDPSSPSDGNDPEAEDSSSDDTSQSEGALDAGSDLPKKLSVSIHAFAQWNVTNPKEDAYTGTINLHFDGSMKLFEAGSPTVQNGLGTFKPELTYKAEYGSVSFAYEESRKTLKRIPSGKCQDPLIFEYHGGGVMPLSKESLFKVHRFSASASPSLKNLSADKQRFLSAIQNSMAVPDYYELMLGPGGKKKRIQGRKKDTGKTDCVYIPVDRDFPGCRVGIQVALPASGALEDSRSWSADDQGLCPPSLGISILDIAATQNKKPLKPTAGGNKNVTYRVSWRIDRIVPGSPESGSQNNTSNPCNRIRNLLQEVERIKALYENDRVRSYVKQNFGEANWGAYQQTLENLFELMGDDPAVNSMDASSITDWLNGLDDQQMRNICTSQEHYSGDGSDLFFEDSNAFSCSTDQDNEGTKATTRMQVNYKGHSIDAALNGQSVPIFTYDNNWENPTPTDQYWEVYRDWVRIYGTDAATAMFQSSVAHEMTHAYQYRTDRNSPFTIDKGSRWEQEAYGKQANVLKEFLEIFDC